MERTGFSPCGRHRTRQGLKPLASRHKWSARASARAADYRGGAARRTVAQMSFIGLNSTSFGGRGDPPGGGGGRK